MHCETLTDVVEGLRLPCAGRRAAREGYCVAPRPVKGIGHGASGLRGRSLHLRQ